MVKKGKCIICDEEFLSSYQGYIYSFGNGKLVHEGCLGKGMAKIAVSEPKVEISKKVDKPVEKKVEKKVEEPVEPVEVSAEEPKVEEERAMHIF